MLQSVAAMWRSKLGILGKTGWPWWFAMGFWLFFLGGWNTKQFCRGTTPPKFNMVSPGNDGVSKLGISGFPTKPHFLEVPCLFWVGVLFNKPWLKDLYQPIIRIIRRKRAQGLNHWTSQVVGQPSDWWLRFGNLLLRHTSSWEIPV